MEKSQGTVTMSEAFISTWPVIIAILKLQKEKKKGRSKALKKLVKKPLFCSAGQCEVFNLQL